MENIFIPIKLDLIIYENEIDTDINYLCNFKNFSFN